MQNHSESIIGFPIGLQEKVFEYIEEFRKGESDAGD